MHLVGSLRFVEETSIQAAPFNLDAQTASLLGQLRQGTDSDLIPLTSAGFLGTTVGDNPNMVNGVSVPLGDEHVLTITEQELIKEATTAYNQAISDIADANGLALLDANSLLTDIAQNGYNFDAGTVTSTFASGGAFSLDGIHLTPRGYAIVANELIKEINITYSASVPGVNIGNYPTITLNNEVN